jgi:murein L,D-transpeptidase YcbB/YkuD
MHKRLLFLVGGAVLLAGCTTVRDQSTVTQLQMRVGELERELEAKDETIGRLQYDVKDLSYEIERIRTPGSRRVEARSGRKFPSSIAIQEDKEGIIRVAADASDVQTALKNAGYYQGSIDGKVGAKTKEAISQFQRDNGLNADGIVGQRTWAELQKNL